MLGIVTAVGGGITRDVLLGNTPPSVFKNPRDVSIAAIVSCLVFIFMIMNASEHKMCIRDRENIHHYGFAFKSKEVLIDGR